MFWRKEAGEVVDLKTANEKLKSEIEAAITIIQNISNADFKIDDYTSTELQTSNLVSCILDFKAKYTELTILEQQENWINTGLASFVETFRFEGKSEEQLYDKIISSIVKYVGANQGGLFLAKDQSELVLKSCYAYDRNKFAENVIKFGEGILGQCYLEAETTMITELPNNYTSITSGLGAATPSVLLLIPIKLDRHVLGVLELASFSVFEPHKIRFLEKLTENLASAVQQSQNSSRMQKLLDEAQFSHEQMQMQEEEMRQNLEELAATQEEVERREKETNQAFTELKEEYQAQLEQVKTREEELKAHKDQLVKALQIDNILIDVAGRNRMLSQKICFLAEMIASGKTQFCDELSNTINLHCNSLSSIINGGRPPAISQEIEFEKAPEFLSEAIANVEKLWIPFKERALVFTTEEYKNKNFKEALEFIEINGLKLLQVNNELVVKCIAYNQSKLVDSGILEY